MTAAPILGGMPLIVDLVVVVVIIAIIYSVVAPALNRRREENVAIGQPRRREPR